MERTRKPPRWAVILIFVLYSAALAAGSFFIGRRSAPNAESVGSATFYATVTGIDGPSLQVEGLDINDINYRGEFTFTVGEDTRLVWRGTALRLDELRAGALVSVTFSGEVLEVYPSILPTVYQVALLDDEK